MACLVAELCRTDLAGDVGVVSLLRGVTISRSTIDLVPLKHGAALLCAVLTASVFVRTASVGLDYRKGRRLNLKGPSQASALTCSHCCVVPLHYIDLLKSY
jgi:hypothetical protein